jgi:hypothetical protein
LPHFDKQNSGWNIQNIEKMTNLFEKNKYSLQSKIGALIFDEMKIKEGLDAPSQIDNMHVVINPNECSNSTPSQKALFTCIPFKFLTGINATGKLKSENCTYF